MRNNKDYVPFGREWRLQMMRLTKAELVELLRKEYIEKNNAFLNRKEPSDA